MPFITMAGGMTLDMSSVLAVSALALAFFMTINGEGNNMEHQDDMGATAWLIAALVLTGIVTTIVVAPLAAAVITGSSTKT